MPAFLELKNIVKDFPGVRALGGVSLQVQGGQVVALVGENGAGKSTLMNILGGVLQPDSGEIIINGEKMVFRSPRDAERAGIRFIHQELSTFGSLTVAENVFADNYPRRFGVLINYGVIRQEAEKIMSDLGSQIPPDVPVSELSMGQRQLVEIARALAKKSRILILDEPTSSLSDSERAQLFRIIRRLKSQGVAIVYISHFLDEVFEIADYVYVLRDGENVGDAAVSDVDRSWIEHRMVGRSISHSMDRKTAATEEIVFEADNLGRYGFFDGISFRLAKGEILGIAGLMGAGRTELARSLFGIDPLDFGTLKVWGKRYRHLSPKLAKRLGIAFVTENRREEGLLLDKTIRENISVASLKEMSNKMGFIVQEREQESALQTIDDLRISCRGTEQWARYLSGGNQQKVVLGKWLFRTPKILILDEPTRGIDVGSKEEIYNLIDRLVKEGASVLLISSDLIDLLRLADRVLVMCNGRMVAELPRQEATPEKIIRYATGGGAAS